MKLKTIVTLTAALVLTAGMAQAAHLWEDAGGWWDEHWTYDKNAPKFTGQEVSLDLFGSYINPEKKFENIFSTNIRKGSWGGGAGLNYFITRNLGLGTDFNVSAKNNDSNPVDYWVGNLYLRLP
ncbi:MAG TPA: hypothetical protein VNZ22_00700, partial [Bacillota bacterium]|nr:hypothetical protein [Bacillota bacterium]